MRRGGRRGRHTGRRHASATRAEVPRGHHALFLSYCYFFALRVLAALPRFAVFFGTLAPAALASERPIAIACLRLVTFLPDLPLFKVPALRSFIARSDRKSTRLNSSHMSISYAVFCLK